MHVYIHANVKELATDPSMCSVPLAATLGAVRGGFRTASFLSMFRSFGPGLPGSLGFLTRVAFLASLRLALWLFFVLLILFGRRFGLGFFGLDPFGSASTALQLQVFGQLPACMHGHGDYQ